MRTQNGVCIWERGRRQLGNIAGKTQSYGKQTTHRVTYTGGASIVNGGVAPPPHPLIRRQLS